MRGQKGRPKRSDPIAVIISFILAEYIARPHLIWRAAIHVARHRGPVIKTSEQTNERTERPKVIDPDKSIVFTPAGMLQFDISSPDLARCHI